MRCTPALLVACVLVYLIEVTNQAGSIRCMKCFDVSGDGTGWALADIRTAETLQSMLKTNETEELAKAGEGSKTGGDKPLRYCPVFQNVTTNSTGSDDVTTCDTNCTTIYVTIGVKLNYSIPDDEKTFRASFDMVQSVMGCAPKTENGSLRACQVLETSTMSTTVDADEEQEFSANLSLTAKSCYVEECNTELCNYNSATLHIISWSLMSAVLWSLVKG